MEKPKYIAYCRRSSEDSREKQALSIPAQVDEIKKRFKDLKIVDWYEESHSAFDIGRPKFNQMVKLIRAGKIQGIICWHPDRIARNAVDGGTIIDLLDKGLLKELKFCSYTYNNDAEGKMMLGIMFSQSKYFSDKLSKDVKRGQEKKIRNGQWPGLAPVGYINTYTKARGENEVIPDPDRFDTIRRMWELLLTENYTVPKIMDKANNEWNLRTIKRRNIGGKPIGMSNTYSMFANPFYCGIIRVKGQYFPGSHKPMITPAQYDLAQNILGRKGKPRPKTHTFDFTGMITCGECGCAITAEDKTKIMKDGLTKTYTYYHCTHKKREMKCSQKSVQGDYVENYILEELEKIKISDGFFKYAKEYLNELNDQEIKDRGDMYQNTENAFTLTQGHLDKLTKAYYRELITEEEFIRQRDELMKEKNKLKNQIEQVDERAKNWLETSLEAFEFVQNAKELFKTGDIDVRKGVMRKLGSNFILKDKIMSFRLNNILKIILEGKRLQKMEATRFELENNGSKTRKNQLSKQLISSWQGQEESNP